MCILVVSVRNCGNPEPFSRQSTDILNCKAQRRCSDAHFSLLVLEAEAQNATIDGPFLDP